MANLAKYNMREAQAIIVHCERTAATHSNANIDPARTKDNYALWPPNAPEQLQLDTGVVGQSSGKYAHDRLMKRLSEVSCLRRDDVNVLCSWCIHQGADVPPGREPQRAFFEGCVRYVASLYGEENIIYAWVQLDETNPHIHIGFVPVIRKELKLRKNASEKTRKAYEAAMAAGETIIERVDADKLITKQHLLSWHSGFSHWMTNYLGYDPGVHTGITEALGGNLSVEELKTKAPDWTEARKLQATAFHDARRARREGRWPTLDNRLELTKPKIQAPTPRRIGLDAMIRSARNRGGKQ